MRLKVLVADDHQLMLAAVRVALDNAQKAGVENRYDMLPGSAFEVDFGGPYEAVLLTNFLHHFDVPTCVSLLKKVHSALRPGGCAATLEFVPNEDRVSPPVLGQHNDEVLGGIGYDAKGIAALKEAGMLGPKATT